MSKRMPAWDEKMSAQDRVLVVLSRAEKGLTQDSIMAAIALWHAIWLNEALLSLLLDNEITARFTGDENANIYDENNYEFSTERASVSEPPRA